MESQLSREFLVTEFLSTLQRVWECQVGRPLMVLPSSDRVVELGDWVAGVVWIGGCWTGSVTLAFPRAFARMLTGQLLDTPPELVEEEQLMDAVRELANMSAGNFKSVLPGACGLATPGFFPVSLRHALADHMETVLSLDCESLDSRFIVELHALS